MRTSRITRSLAAITMLGVLAVSAGMVGANIPDADGVVHGCIKPSGKLRLIDTETAPPGTCKPRERPVQWHQEGPPGPATGPAGGDLDGSYPDPTLRDGAVTPAAHAPLPAVRVQHADGIAGGAITTQSIASTGVTTFTNVSFDVELYDTDGMFDPAQPTRITVRTAGVYVLTGAVRWDLSDAGSRSLGLVRNAIGIAFLAADTRDATDGNATRQNVSTVTRLAENDFIELKVSQNSGAPLNVNNNGAPQVHLSATWLAP